MKMFDRQEILIVNNFLKLKIKLHKQKEDIKLLIIKLIS